MDFRQRRRAPQHLRDVLKGHMAFKIELTPALREFMQGKPPGKYDAKIVRVHQEGRTIVETLGLPGEPSC